jgi:hypothetical protein
MGKVNVQTYKPFPIDLLVSLRDRWFRDRQTGKILAVTGVDTETEALAINGVWISTVSLLHGYDIETCDHSWEPAGVVQNDTICKVGE